jgi:hypothetical protein
MRNIAPMVALLCILFTLIIFSYSKREESGSAGSNAASTYLLYTVRADGLCLYANVEKDGSYQKFADKTRVWTPSVKDSTVIFED